MRPLNSKQVFLISLLLCLSGHSALSETVFVCKGEGEGGSTLFSEKPCKSAQGHTLHFPDNYSVGEGLSELERKNLSAIETREREEKRETLKLSPPLDEESTVTLKNDKKVDPEACDQAKTSLQQWRKVMSLGYLPDEEAYYIEELKKKMASRNELCGLVTQ